jgi:16S rRNA processing protein RimM
MNYNCRILIGKIARINGYEGFATVRLEKEFIGNIPEMRSVFIEVEGRPVPFSISSNEYTGGDSLRLKFEGYDTYEKISEFCGCRVFLASPVKKVYARSSAPSLAGFTVVTPDMKTAGTVGEVIRNPAQDLLKMISPGKKEILVPFHEDLILKIDKKNKKIVIDIPDGLMELN